MLARVPLRVAHFSALLFALGLCAHVRADPGVSVDQYRPPANSDDGLATQTPQVGQHLRLGLRLDLDYGRNPLVYETARGDADSTQVALVRDQLRLWLGASLSLFDRLLVFAGLPLDLLLQGSALGRQPTATGFGAGDLALGARGFVWGNDVFRLGLQLSLTLPTAADARDTPKVAGDSGATLLPVLLSELSLGPLRLDLEAGLRLRRRVSLPGVQVRDQLLFAAALRLPVASERFWLSTEIFGSTLSADVGKRQTTMIEALLGARLHVTDDVRIGLAGSKGLTRGYGVPELRGVLSVAWVPSLAGRTLRPEPEPEREPEREPDLPAPLPPPPVAATAEPVGPADLDGDGWNDETDGCPALPAPGSQSGCPALVAYDAVSGQLELTPAPTWKTATAQLQPRSLTALGNLAGALAGRPALRLLITSHLDPKQRRPPPGLGAERARVVGQWLSEHGLRPEQLELYDCGSTRPANRGPRAKVRDERSELFLIAPLPQQGMPSTLGCSPVPLQPTAAVLGALTPAPDAHSSAREATPAPPVPHAPRAAPATRRKRGSREPGSSRAIRRTIDRGVRAP